jgi:hypothetical protein
MKFKIPYSFSVLILVLLVFWTPQVIAQGSDSTYVYQAENFTDNLAGETVSIPCQFKLQPTTNQFEWIQKQGLYKTVFMLTNPSGNWPHAAAEGTIMFSAISGSAQGDVTIEHSGDTITLTLVLSSPSGNINNTYSITSIIQQ